MTLPNEPEPQPKGQILVYPAEDGRVKNRCSLRERNRLANAAAHGQPVSNHHPQHQHAPPELPPVSWTAFQASNRS